MEAKCYRAMRRAQGKMLREYFSRANAGCALSHAPAEVEPLEVRFAHPVRLSPATHSQGHGRPCLQRLHLRRGFSLHMVFPGVFFSDM